MNYDHPEEVTAAEAALSPAAQEAIADIRALPQDGPDPGPDIPPVVAELIEEGIGDEYEPEDEPEPVEVPQRFVYEFEQAAPRGVIPRGRDFIRIEYLFGPDHNRQWASASALSPDEQFLAGLPKAEDVETFLALGYGLIERMALNLWPNQATAHLRQSSRTGMQK